MSNTTECPRCGLSPAYRRKLADPWDTHYVCIDCGHDYTHARPAVVKVELADLESALAASVERARAAREAGK